MRALAGAGDGALFVSGVVLACLAGATGLTVGTALKHLDGPGEAPAPVRWATCAVGGGLATWAMPVPNGVLVRTADDRGADVVLVPIRRRRDAQRFLAGLGCGLPGEP